MDMKFQNAPGRQLTNVTPIDSDLLVFLIHYGMLVLCFQKCYDYYTSGEIRMGEDGIDEQCRWCGDGGKLIICDYCSNAFCKHCIKHNLGRGALADITGEGQCCFTFFYVP